MALLSAPVLLFLALQARLLSIACHARSCAHHWKIYNACFRFTALAANLHLRICDSLCACDDSCSGYLDESGRAVSAWDRFWLAVACLIRGRARFHLLL